MGRNNQEIKMKKSPTSVTNQQNNAKQKKLDNEEHKSSIEEKESFEAVNTDKSEQSGTDFGNNSNNNEGNEIQNNAQLNIDENNNKIDNLEDSAKSIVELLDKWRGAFNAVSKTEAEVLEQLELVKINAVQVRKEREEDLEKMKGKAKQLA